MISSAACPIDAPTGFFNNVVEGRVLVIAASLSALLRRYTNVHALCLSNQSWSL